MPDSHMAPERAIKSALDVGIAAYTANLSALFDATLGDLPADELAAAKARWPMSTPKVVMGYPRMNFQVPCIAVVLQSDNHTQDYLDVGAQAAGDDSEDGIEWKNRLANGVTVYVFADNVNEVYWLYRIVRRILNVARSSSRDHGGSTSYFHQHKMYSVTLSGSELIPDPQYAPENMHIRRVTVAFEYEEIWNNNDALWTAFYSGASSILSSAGTLNVKHEDAGGGVRPNSDD